MKSKVFYIEVYKLKNGRVCQCRRFTYRTVNRDFILKFPLRELVFSTLKDTRYRKDSVGILTAF